MKYAYLLGTGKFTMASTLLALILNCVTWESFLVMGVWNLLSS
jgi:hypothetical protein